MALYAVNPLKKTKIGLDALVILWKLRSLPELTPRKESAVTHQDQGRNVYVCSHVYALHKAMQWHMVGVSMIGIAFRAECSWTPAPLVFAALLWAWSDEKTLLERFGTARKIVIFRFAKQSEPAGSYQAFIKMLCIWPDPLR